METEDHKITYPLLPQTPEDIESLPLNTSTAQNIHLDPVSSASSNDLALNRSTINDLDPQDTSVVGPLKLKGALKIILVNTIPMIVMYLIQFSIKNLAIHLLKSENNDQLTNAVGLANTLLNVITIALFVSFNTGLMACCAQAFGAKNYQLLGLYLHRSFIINLIVLIPGCCALYWADDIAMLMGFDAVTASYVQQITSYCIIGIFSFMIYETLACYLNACDIFVAPAVVLMICAVVYWVLSVLLITKYNMQLSGFIISFNIMQTLAAILIFLYIKIKNPVPGSFFWFTRSSFQGIWKLFKYEFFVGSMVFMEWICFEIIYLFSGKLSIVQINAFTVAMTNQEIWYSIPLSFGETVLTFVGNSIGEGNVKKAKNFLKAGLIWNIITLSIIEVYYFIMLKPSIEFYTEDAETVEDAMKIMRIYQVIFLPDFVQVILSSGLRAVGKEKTGSVMFILCYYCVGIPLSYILCFVVDLKVYGLLCGPLASVLILNIWLVIVFWRLDWDKQVERVTNRIDADDKELP